MQKYQRELIFHLTDYEALINILDFFHNNVMQLCVLLDLYRLKSIVNTRFLNFHGASTRNYDYTN
jgi:hypothetical protein